MRSKTDTNVLKRLHDMATPLRCHIAKTRIKISKVQRTQVDETLHLVVGTAKWPGIMIFRGSTFSAEKLTVVMSS